MRWAAGAVHGTQKQGWQLRLQVVSDRGKRVVGSTHQPSLLSSPFWANLSTDFSSGTIPTRSQEKKKKERGKKRRQAYPYFRSAYVVTGCLHRFTTLSDQPLDRPSIDRLSLSSYKLHLSLHHHRRPASQTRRVVTTTNARAGTAPALGPHSLETLALGRSPASFFSDQVPAAGPTWQLRGRDWARGRRRGSIPRLAVTELSLNKKGEPCLLLGLPFPNDCLIACQFEDVYDDTIKSRRLATRDCEGRPLREKYTV